MNLTREVDYRLAKWILVNLRIKGLVTEGESKVIWQSLIRRMNPPLKNLEEPDEGLFKVDGWDHKALKPFYSRMIKCDECGGIYTPQMWHSTSSNDVVWCCSRRNSKDIRCKNLHLYEEELNQLLLICFQRILQQHGLATGGCLLEVRRGIKDEKRKGVAGAAVAGLFSCPPENLALDIEDFLTVLKEIRIKKCGVMKAEMLDGEVLKIPIPKYSPCYGWREPFEALEQKKGATMTTTQENNIRLLRSQGLGYGNKRNI